MIVRKDLLMTARHISLSAAVAILLVACSGQDSAVANGEPDRPSSISPIDVEPFTKKSVAEFNEPWAMTFLPDGRMLVSEKPGNLWLVTVAGSKTEVAGVPGVAYGGQGGLGDIILSPDFATSGQVFLSWAEADSDDNSKRGAVVGRATLTLDGDQPALRALEIIWRQVPKVSGRGHYSHRLIFSPDGKYLFIGSGERQKFDPAQDMASNLGKIVRIFPDGSIPKDNPFLDTPGALPEIWSLGHRNILGLAFDAGGRLWNQEMGPKHGDELNLVIRAGNYGYPIVSNGDHYDGKPIPDHATRPEFEAPKTWWDKSIAPAGLIYYDGDAFPAWKGSFFIGGLASEALIRVAVQPSGSAEEAERFAMGKRIREVEQGPDGHIWLLEDGKGARLLKLSPPN
jgi:glucose/arabinose dehydrogenase